MMFFLCVRSDFASGGCMFLKYLPWSDPFTFWPSLAHFPTENPAPAHFPVFTPVGFLLPFFSILLNISLLYHMKLSCLLWGITAKVKMCLLCKVENGGFFICRSLDQFGPWPARGMHTSALHGHKFCVEFVPFTRIRPGRCPEILKFVLKLELGPEICTYILKFSRVFTFFFKKHVFTIFLKTHIIVLILLMVSNTGHKKAALSQISALKWHVEVIQGQSFYAHWNFTCSLESR